MRGCFPYSVTKIFLKATCAEKLAIVNTCHLSTILCGRWLSFVIFVFHITLSINWFDSDHVCVYTLESSSPGARWVYLARKG